MFRQKNKKKMVSRETQRSKAFVLAINVSSAAGDLEGGRTVSSPVGLGQGWW